MKIYLIVLASLVVAACGGGGGGGSSSQSGLDLVVSHFNSTLGVNRINYMEVSESTGEVSVGVDCITYTPFTREQLAPDVSSSFANGVCFDDDTECNRVTENALLTTQATIRLVEVIEGNNNTETIVFNGFSSGVGALGASVIEGVSSCNDSVKPSIPRFNGVYVGNLYSIDKRTAVVADQNIIKSAPITLDCVNGSCRPRDDRVLFGAPAAGIDLTPSSTATGDYIRAMLSTQAYVRGYNIFATSDNSGNAISMIGYPIGKGASYFDCYDGGCVTLSFKKVN